MRGRLQDHGTSGARDAKKIRPIARRSLAVVSCRNFMAKVLWVVVTEL
jgi:hypothetical protein